MAKKFGKFVQEFAYPGLYVCPILSAAVAGGWTKSTLSLRDTVPFPPSTISIFLLSVCVRTNKKEK